MIRPYMPAFLKSEVAEVILENVAVFFLAGAMMHWLN